MKDTGSLVNWMSVNPNYTEPKVGMDVTKCMWSDRHAYHIIAVDDDKRGFTMVEYKPKYVGKAYGDESYEYEDANGNLLLNTKFSIHLRYRYKKWRDDDGKGSEMNLAFNMRDEYRDPSF